MGIFRSGGGEDTLAAVERRYAWWRRMFRRFDQDFGDVFPAAWQVGRNLCVDFAKRTARHIETILRAVDPPESVDVEHLLRALTKTLQFERDAVAQFDQQVNGDEAELPTFYDDDGEIVS